MCVLSVAMISMVRLLEKPGLARYLPECVEGKFSEVELPLSLFLRSSPDPRLDSGSGIIL